MTIAAGILLIAVGAILRYATNFHVQDVDMDTVGLILIIAGAAGLALSFLQDAIWSKRREPGVERPIERERFVERR
jgi:hypothetical protein